MYRVLIVDDEFPFLQSLKMYDWSSNDCICVGQASNGKEALTKCMNLAPHIVITDINMPVVDGITFLSHVHEKYPEIQVILLTVYQNFEYARSAIEYGACAYIVKDMDYSNQLTQALKKAISAYCINSQGADKRENLLHKSGHIIVLNNDEIDGPQKEDLSDFLQKEYEALVTVYCPNRYQTMTQLISEVDSLPEIIRETAGIIVRNNACFEILLNADIKHIRSFLTKLFSEKWKRFVTDSLLVSYGACQPGVIHYLSCHQENMNAIDQAFYEEHSTFRIVPGSRVECKPIPPYEINSWSEELELVYRKDGDIRNMFVNITNRCKEQSYRPKEIKQAFHQMLSRCELSYATKSDDQAHQMLTESYHMKQLVDVIAKAISNLKKEQSNYSYIVNQAVDYMMSNLNTQGLQLSDVSEFVGMSPGYLSKKLKEETGSTFQELLIKMRMEKAFRLLTNSNKKVYEVAEIVGYDNYRSFANAFSNYYHKSPKNLQ